MYQNYIIASSEVKLYLTLANGTTLNMVTGTELSYNFAQQVQDIFAIGQTDPIGTKKINATYTANLSLQEGELQTIIDAANATFAATAQIATLLQLEPFTITWTETMAGLNKTVSHSLLNCRVPQQNGTTNRNDAETIGSIELKGTGVARTIVPIA